MLRRAVARRLALGVALIVGLIAWGATPGLAAGSPRVHLDCREATVCAELANPQEGYGNYYIGHDEPSVLFYSNRPGSGNRMKYTVTLPHDPSPSNPNAPGKSYQFELGSTFWLGMAMCDTQSYPEQVSTCKPDSDRNVTKNLARHPGVAFTELQFYSPGWVAWPTWAVAAGASTCDPTKWCAALTIDSLSEDPVNGTIQNGSCIEKAGFEYVNFAFITHNGKSHAPANPLQSTLDTFTPNASRDLFMNQGDRIAVKMFDTANGLKVVLNDLTTGQSGRMTASPANGFAQIKYAPTGNKCQAIPYAFHPMYNTSSEATQTIWGADQYNIAFDEEIGHFQRCNGAAVPFTDFGVTDNGTPISCPAGNTEENAEPADGDDNYCFPEDKSLLVRVQGCTDTNTGFDGLSYEPVWPDGNTALHPEPIRFTSPLTGGGFDRQYERAALSVDLPRIESTCNRDTAQGCTLIPTTDDGTPAEFYPYYSITDSPNGCLWQIGGAIPGTTNDFGGNAGYGHLIHPKYLTFGAGGATDRRWNDFRNVFSSNPCPA